jgi:hypothetical protein
MVEVKFKKIKEKFIYSIFIKTANRKLHIVIMVEIMVQLEMKLNYQLNQKIRFQFKQQQQQQLQLLLQLKKKQLLKKDLLQANQSQKQKLFNFKL